MRHIFKFLVIAYFMIPSVHFAHTPNSMTDIRTPEGIRSIFCNDNCHCVAVGYIEYGYDPDQHNSCPTMMCKKLIAYTSEDAGKHWVPAKFIPAMSGSWGNTFNKVDCGNDGLRCTAVGTEGFGEKFTGILILNSLDGGMTWQRVNQPVIPPNTDGHIYEDLHSVSCDNDGIRCVAVGEYFAGMNLPVAIPPLALYTMEGQQWYLSKKPMEPRGDSHEMFSVICNKKNMHCRATGYVKKDQDKIPIAYKTLDGGRIWEND